MIRTTIVGYGMAAGKSIKSYLERLDEQLSACYPAISWRIYDEAQKDAVLPFLSQRLESKVLIHHPNIVFINLSSIETNTMSAMYMDIRGYENLLREMLEAIHDHYNRTGLNGCIPIPVVITPPPIDETENSSGCTNNRLKQYIYSIKRVVKEVNGVTLDLFEQISKKVNSHLYIENGGKNLSQMGEDLLYDLVFIELTRLINYQGVLKDRDVMEEMF